MDKPCTSYKGDAPYIFVSYAHDDTREVFKHIRRLHQEGFRLWYDEGIEPGVNWYETLESKIRNCECILLFMSKHSQQSQYISKEITCAIEHNKHIVCIMLDNETLKGPFKLMLCDTQSIPNSELEHVEEFYSKLSNSLRPDLTRANRNEDTAYPSVDNTLKHRSNGIFTTKKSAISFLSALFIGFSLFFFVYNKQTDITYNHQNYPTSIDIKKEIFTAEDTFTNLVNIAENYDFDEIFNGINATVKNLETGSPSSLDDYIDTHEKFAKSYEKYLLDIKMLYDYLLTSSSNILHKEQKDKYIDALRKFFDIDKKIKDFNAEIKEMKKEVDKFNKNFDKEIVYMVLRHAAKLFALSNMHSDLSLEQCESKYANNLRKNQPAEDAKIVGLYRTNFRPLIHAIFESYYRRNKAVQEFKKFYNDMRPYIKELKTISSHSVS